MGRKWMKSETFHQEEEQLLNINNIIASYVLKGRVGGLYVEGVVKEGNRGMRSDSELQLNGRGAGSDGRAEIMVKGQVMLLLHTVRVAEQLVHWMKSPTHGTDGTFWA